jgi:hypothetical protein
MKRNIGWVLVALGGCAASKIMPYLEGRSNSVWAIPFLILPASLLPLLLSLVCCGLLFGSAISALALAYSYKVTLKRAGGCRPPGGMAPTNAGGVTFMASQRDLALTRVCFSHRARRSRSTSSRYPTAALALQ